MLAQTARAQRRTIEGVEEVRLVCGAEVVPFYGSMGVRVRLDAGQLMLWTPDQGAAR